MAKVTITFYSEVNFGGNVVTEVFDIPPGNPQHETPVSIACKSIKWNITNYQEGQEFSIHLHGPYGQIVLVHYGQLQGEFADLTASKANMDPTTNIVNLTRGGVANVEITFYSELNFGGDAVTKVFAIPPGNPQLETSVNIPCKSIKWDITGCSEGQEISIHLHGPYGQIVLVHYGQLQGEFADLTASMANMDPTTNIVNLTRGGVAIVTNGKWEGGVAQQAKLLAADGAANDWFGYSVAIDGDTAIVGAYQDDDKGANSGSAYVFVKEETGWIQQAKLTAADGAADDRFGLSVAISGDTAIVGAYKDDDKGTDSGSAYVFVRSGSNWTQQAKLLAADGAAGDSFGWPVSIDGDTAIVGAAKDDDKGTDSGSAYVFVRSGSNWSQQTKLLADDGVAGDQLGRSLAIDGDTAIVGAWLDDDKGLDSGSAYVFVRSGSDWSQQAKLTSANGAFRDYFGHSVAIEGDTAMVGSYADDDKGAYSGSAYVFVRNGSGWSQQAKLTPDDGAGGDSFGWAVAIDGDTAIISAYADDDKGSASGSVYVFVRSGNDWDEITKLTAGDGAENDYFGRSVSISGDTAVISANADDDNGSNSGSAYIF